MFKRKNILKIAIDSPAAAGAGTLAKSISKNYNLFYLDTGKIYRYVAYLKLKFPRKFDNTFIKELKTAAKSVESIFLATDLDREGEAIAWHLQEALGADKFNYSRVRFNQITKDAILESFEDPKEIDANLVEAQQARRFLDRVVGFELSPLLWAKIARNLSAGRVQSVALRLLVEREHSIQKFKPDEFWEISFNAQNDKNHGIAFNLNRKKSDPLLQAEESKKLKN